MRLSVLATLRQKHSIDQRCTTGEGIPTMEPSEFLVNPATGMPQ